MFLISVAMKVTSYVLLGITITMCSGQKADPPMCERQDYPHIHLLHRQMPTGDLPGRRRGEPRQLKETRQPASEAGTRGSPTITTTWKNSSPQPSPPKAGATEKPTRWSLGFPRWREPSTIPGTLQPLPSAQGPQLHLTWLTPNSPQGKAYTQSENWLCPAPTGGQTAGRG